MKGIELIPYISETIVGSHKRATFRVSISGKNYAINKQTNSSAGDSLIMTAMNGKYDNLTEDDLKYWENIAKEKNFRSRFTAFSSSFFMSVKIYGLSTTILQPLQYHNNPDRWRNYQHNYNSLARNAKYKLKDGSIPITTTWLDYIKDKARLSSYIHVPNLTTGDSVLRAYNANMLERIDNSTDEMCYEAVVNTITDGDTVKITRWDNSSIETIRLRSIDCPETYTNPQQPYGTEARDYVYNEVYDKIVTIVPYGKDNYNRVLADIIYFNASKYPKHLNRNLVKNGLAWWYRYYSDDVKLQSLQRIAIEKNLGLWADPNPIPPWDWRQTYE